VPKIYDDSHGVLDGGKQADFLWSGDLSVILFGSDRVARYDRSLFDEDMEKDIEKDFSHAFDLRGSTQTSYCGFWGEYSVYKIGAQPFPNCIQVIINKKTRWCQVWKKWQPSKVWGSRMGEPRGVIFESPSQAPMETGRIKEADGVRSKIDISKDATDYKTTSKHPHSDNHQ